MKKVPEEMPDFCPNCGTTWIKGGHFCYHCGQDAHSYRKSFVHLFLDFFETFLHFDTKTFKTFRVMFFKPGQITLDYLSGKRAQYVPPFRLYIFLSVIFFFLLSSTSSGDNSGTPVNVSGNMVDTTANSWKFDVIGESVTVYNEEDSIRESGDLLNQENRLEEIFLNLVKKIEDMPPEKLRYEVINMFSKIMFLLMPIFALLLKVFYIRRKYLYYDHLIFAIHTHTQAILLLLIALIFYRIFPDIDTGTVAYLVSLVFVFLAMKKVYAQSWLKTIFKFSIISLIYLIVLSAGLLSSLFLGISLSH